MRRCDSFLIRLSHEPGWLARLTGFIGMFAGRWMGVLWDKFARKRKVRIIGVDRPGVGGTPSVLLEERVQTWLGELLWWILLDIQNPVI